MIWLKLGGKDKYYKDINHFHAGIKGLGDKFEALLGSKLILGNSNVPFPM